MEKVIEIFKGHLGNLERLISQKFEDVEVVQFTQSIQALVKLFIVFMFTVSNKPFKNNIIALGSDKSMDYSGHGARIISKFFHNKLEHQAFIAAM